MNNEAAEGACYICGHLSQDVLQEHHIIPRRYGGSDASRNLVHLCPSCHDSVERIYDDTFYDELGIEKESQATEAHTCEWRTCTNEETYRLENGDIDIYVCEGHRECVINRCTNIGSPVHIYEGGRGILCDNHRVCGHDDCLNNDVKIYRTQYMGSKTLCETHAKENPFVDFGEVVGIEEGGES